MAFSGDNLLTLATVRDNNFVLDNHALYEIMNMPEMKEGSRPLVIICIAGTFRSGKSFVMNFFLRYLRNKGWENPKWFGGDDTSLTGDFPWKRGSDACTKGMNIFPEVFSVPTADGRQAAVILVDTQGLFDDDTPPDINAKLMSLSTLFCSHQILNLMRQIEERDLEHLELCIAFAKAAGNLAARRKPFQNLTFLVRDWEHEENYGDSTDGYLHKYFSKKSKSTVVQKVKNSILDAFHNVGCTLLPHPGRKVVKPEGRHKPTNRDLDGEFKEFVMKFVTSVLHPSNLVIKRGNDGKEQTMAELGNLLGTVGNAFKAGKVPTAQTLLQSAVKGHNTAALIEAAEKYKGMMRKECQGILDAETLRSSHQTSLQQAIVNFRTLANMGDEDSKVDSMRQLEKECNDDFASLQRVNENRKSEKRHELRILMSKCTANYAGKLKQIGLEADRDAFNRKHLGYQQESMSEFDRAARKYLKVMPEIANLRRELEKSLTSRYEDIIEAWTEKKERKKREMKDESDKCMDKLTEQFENEVYKYQAKDVENLEGILAHLKKSYVDEYSRQMAGKHKDSEELKRKLDRIIMSALKNNKEKYDIMRESIQITGKKYGEELEKKLQKPMADAYLVEGVFNQYIDRFLEENVSSDEKYKKLPGWGKKIVDDAIADVVRDLKAKNASHKGYRSVEISNFDIFLNILKGIILLPVTILKTIWNFVTSLFSK